MENKGTFTLLDTDQEVTIHQKDIYNYRGSMYGTSICMLDGTDIRVNESFEEVDKVFDFLTPVDSKIKT